MSLFTREIGIDRKWGGRSWQYLTGVWDAPVKQRVREAFLLSGLHYAEDTFLRVERLLDEHCGQWVAMHGETCEATHVHGTQSDEMLDLKMGCLERKLGKIKALIEVFGQEADAGTVEKAVQAVSKLGTLAVCWDEEYLTAVYPPPEDPQARARVKEIQKRLDRVEALDKAGKYNKGLELLEGVREEAGQIDHPPLNAKDLYLSGLLLGETGKYKEAEEDIHASILQAAKAKDYRLYAKSWNALVSNIGCNQARYEEALKLQLIAESVLEIANNPPELRADLFNNLGFVFYQQGKYDKALEHHQRALTIREKALGSEHPDVAKSLSNLGLVFCDQGKYDKALEHHQRALTIREKALGSEHPDVAISLNNLGIVFRKQGKYDKALEHYQRALTIWEKALGPEHPHVATNLNNLGNVFYEQGKYDKAMEHHKRALTIKEKALGPEHPDVAVSLHNLGIVFRYQGKYDKALEHHQRALTIWEKALGPEHPHVAVSLNELGKVFRKQGKYDKALRNYERASAICEKKTCEAEIVPEIRFNLARALWEKGGPSRGRSLTLAEQARDVYSKMEQKKKELLEVEEWLKKRKRPGK